MLKRWWKGLQERPVVRVAIAMAKRYQDEGGPYLASAVAYHAFLSFFPLILLALSVIGFFLTSPEARAEWIGRITQVLPGLQSAVGDLVTSIVGGRAGTGILGLVGLAWTGIGVVEASRFTMARVFHRGDRLPFLKRKAAALGTLATLGPLSLAGVALTAVVTGVQLTGPGGLALRAGGWLLIGTLAVGLFAVSYRVLVPKPGPPWREVWPGAVLAAVGWMILQLVGAVYVAQVVTRASAVYGSLAAIIGLLILLHLGARVFLYGAVLNAELVDRRKDKRPNRS